MCAPVELHLLDMVLLWFCIMYIFMFLLASGNFLVKAADSIARATLRDIIVQASVFWLPGGSASH